VTVPDWEWFSRWHTGPCDKDSGPVLAVVPWTPAEGLIYCYTCNQRETFPTKANRFEIARWQYAREAHLYPAYYQLLNWGMNPAKNIFTFAPPEKINA
jgi:hypothetical protein